MESKIIVAHFLIVCCLLSGGLLHIDLHHKNDNSLGLRMSESSLPPHLPLCIIDVCFRWPRGHRMVSFIRRSWGGRTASGSLVKAGLKYALTSPALVKVNALKDEVGRGGVSKRLIRNKCRG